VKLDTSLFPLVVLRWEGGVSDEELEELLRVGDAVTERAAREGVQYALVGVSTGEVTPVQRKRLAQWTEGRAELRKKWEAGAHIVLRGALARGALTAITWLLPQLANVHVHPDEASALSAAKTSLARANARRVG
jgi:hypothetical protein